MMKIFAVIIIAGGSLLLVIGATGGFTDVLRDFCEKNPKWCGEGTDDDEDNYNIALLSTEVLVRALNCVLEPSTCSCSEQKCEFSVDEDKMKNAGFFDSVLAEKVNTITLECKQDTTPIASKPPEIKFENLLLPFSVAEERCKEGCVESEGCTSYLKYSSEALTYDLIRDKTLLRFSCSYDGTAYDSVIAFSRQEARAKCIEVARNDGKEISMEIPDPKLYLQYHDAPANNGNQYNTVSSVEARSSVKARKCTCDLLGQRRETYSVFGFTDEEARDLCIADSKTKYALYNCCFDPDCNIKSSPDFTPSISSYGYCFDETKCEDYEGDVMFSSGTKPLDIYRFKCTHEFTGKPPFSCNVENFQLPQYINNAEDWIGGYGDPEFLVYWQAFPQGENTDWTEMGSWYSGIATIGFGASCVLGTVITGAKVIKSAIKPGNVVNAIRSFKTSRTISKIAASKSIDKDKIVTEVVDTLIDLENRGLIKLEKVLPDMIKYAEQGKSTLAKSFKKILFPVMKAKLIEKGLITKSHDTFKALAIRSATLTATTSTIYGVGAGIQAEKDIQADMDAYADARLESELGKFFPSDVPNSIQFQRSLIERKPYNLKGNIIKMDKVITDPTNQNIMDLKMPVVLNKNVELLGFGDAITEFYLASPCIANVQVSKERVRCGVYEYDVRKDEVKCVSPNEGTGFFSGLKTNIFELKSCGSLLSTVQPGKDKIQNEYNLIQNLKTIVVFQRDANVDVPQMEGIPEESCHDDGLCTIKRDVIYDKIYDKTLFFDRNSNEVDFIKHGELPIEAIPLGVVTNCFTGLNRQLDNEKLSLDEKTHICEIKVSNTLTQKLKYRIYLEDNEGKMGPVFGYGVGLLLPGIREIVFIIKDVYPEETPDGKADFVESYYMNDLIPRQQRVFIDYDSDGDIDALKSDKCYVDAISVTPTKIKPEGDEPNYCFKRDYSGYVDFAATTTSIGLSSLAKVSRIGGITGWALSAGTDCILMVATAKMDKAWPES
ncbi:hypothetical protein KAR91_43955 [Candidatus Pacearchaeota archaeon]|nr:hypothetical protein [Candidatus Pacearchaeota archaeon]